MHPACREDIEVQCLAVKEVNKPVVGLPTKVQYPHENGDPHVVAAATQADQDQSHPHKGVGATTGWSQSSLRLRPLGPKLHEWVS
jgi:hypothetical protein